ncbi:MAG: MTH938/NDUFAF3 family protein [Spirochaetales bacterium]|uniref:MTH938/NDUFAF3 family protein n=1 Tax=Candidatus Thalassospirochaeta sargassi TaxID=3119039 RepID=A0AAJ1IFN4_9SPIO|nr:MTH938/NDUFAF3 family protein [Spirochaetales bacterium]
MIDSISMGKMAFMGKVSRSDTIVYPDHMNTKWWIAARTTIEPADLEDVFKAEPEVVVVGLGFVMPISISDAAISALEEKGIEVLVEKSEKAAELYNEISTKKKTIGLFHLL